MSREIKFRGKRKDNGKWIYGFLMNMYKDRLFIGIWHNIGGEATIKDELFFSYPEVIPETVGQYTGLKDKNGKEIYEGDVVVQDCYLWFDEGKPNYRGTVEMIYQQWQVVAHCVNPDKQGISDGINESLNFNGFEDNEKTNWEVIGNIFENPELL